MISVFPHLVWWYPSPTYNWVQTGLLQKCARPQLGRWIGCVAIDAADDWMVSLAGCSLVYAGTGARPNTRRC